MTRVWLAEGLTLYLEESAVRQLFSAIASLAVPGSRLGADFVSAAPPGIGVPIRFTTTAVTAFLGDCGWAAVEYAYDQEIERLGRRWGHGGPPAGCLALARRT